MDKPSYRDGYGPFLANCCVAEFNNIEELQKAISRKTAAVVLEFIQGEGGIHPVSEEFINGLRQLKERFGFLLIADEIQAGIGRTGKLFGFQHFNINPDIIVIAKPIGGGLPLGAILGNAAVADVLEPGVHGTTFGGNPVACAAGIVVMHEMFEGGVMHNATLMGTLLQSKLKELQHEFPQLVKEVRGFGLMIGMELTREGDSIVKTLRERGVLVNCTAQTVLRFLPPLIIQKVHIEETLAALRIVFNEID
jgi:acetylornithine/succinyldiaminopimelate/putrescine aminotransferase